MLPPSGQVNEPPVRKAPIETRHQHVYNMAAQGPAHERALQDYKLNIFEDLLTNVKSCRRFLLEEESPQTLILFLAVAFELKLTYFFFSNF
ncbi:hypothetical protein NDU88_006034 [Pleurodeles waltl]|uniref:Uncharacterized protein n=1 Tax=Pleurodeles waltl TaxID=8319 RepID=A0AAV7PM94_PLEWA|nr:hypothetical protein NDU88_006034 [Pleurodeles waltl]